VFATALFYGDSMITPAISVLSAVEGLTTVNRELTSPSSSRSRSVFSSALFAFRARGTPGRRVFGPIMIVYFLTLAALGISLHRQRSRDIIETLNPMTPFASLLTDGWRAFLALGSVVLAVTGAEALYADMGHFAVGRSALSWLVFVCLRLMLNYMGKGR
jgi:KUP system potassium uptake protein